MKRVSRIIFGNKLRVGQRVIGTYEDGSEHYHGVVVEINSNYEEAMLQLNGNPISRWSVRKHPITKKWKSDMSAGGDLIILNENL